MAPPRPARQPRPGRPARRSLPPLPHTRGISFREFPGLLKQLPHHKPWVVTIGLISAVVVLAACGFGSFLLFQNEAGVGVSDGTGTAVKRDISTREADPTPLTVPDVFPATEWVAEEGLPPYRMVGEPQAGEDCGVAADRQGKTVLDEAGCSQFVRATFVSWDDRFYVTAGVLNLPDQEAAKTLQTDLVTLGGSATYLGHLTGYQSSGDLSVFVKAKVSRTMEVHGHFLLYVVVARMDGGDTGPDDEAAKVVTHDMLKLYLRDQVMANWASGGTAPEAPATDAPAEPTGSAAG